MLQLCSCQSQSHFWFLSFLNKQSREFEQAVVALGWCLWVEVERVKSMLFHNTVNVVNFIGCHKRAV